MRNKYFLLLFIFFLISNKVHSTEFEFEVESLKLIDGEKKIIALNGKAINKNLNLEIFGDEFEYNKIEKILIIKKQGVALFNSEKIKINFNKGIFDQNRTKIFLEDSVIVESLDNEFQLKSNKIIYDYDKKIINSDKKSILKDKLGNTYYSDRFMYDIKTDVIKLEYLQFIDEKKNVLKSPISFINLKSGKIFGKDIEVNLLNTFLNQNNEQNNEPRMKGNSFVSNNENTTINKGVFSTCKKRDGCPPWQIVSKKIIHDKKKKQSSTIMLLLKFTIFQLFIFQNFSIQILQ